MALPNILIRPAATISRSITVLLWPCALCGQIQEAQSAWNSERALALVGQARDLRQVTAVDSAFQAYQADAHGYVYFFFDPTDSAERLDRHRVELRYAMAPDGRHDREEKQPQGMDMV